VFPNKRLNETSVAIPLDHEIFLVATFPFGTDFDDTSSVHDWRVAVFAVAHGIYLFIGF
jgi:hypothetical protein